MDDNTREIPLTKGKFAIIDASDYEWLMQWKWHITGRGYAARNAKNAEREAVGKKTVQMHRVINQTPKGFETDHINGNPLDNRRANLRSSNRGENCRNRKAWGTARSGYKGVYFRKDNGKWAASIQINKKRLFLGLFPNQEAAALAYNEAAIRNHGEHAVLNKL